MSPITQSIQGNLYEQNGRFALHLSPTASTYYLRYALVELGPESHIFPSSVLDDWGTEISGIKLYNWLFKEGPSFPRGEIFGVDQTGKNIQVFVRAIEINQKYPTYLYRQKTDPISDGRPLSEIWLTEPTTLTPTPSKNRPASLKRPLKRSALNWVQIPPDYIPLQSGWQLITP